LNQTYDLGRALIGKKLLIFDFDGTIANTNPLHAAAFEKVLVPLGIDVHYPYIAGMKTADAIIQCATANGLELTEDQIKELQIAKQSAVRDLIALELEPMQDVDWFLEWASQKFHLSMATSGSRGTVTRSLDKLGFIDLFDPLVCADDIERAKPHPDSFLKVLSLTGYQPNQALVFEDSEAGHAAAHAAGISCIRVNEKSWSQFKMQIQ
jgi:HAD superfamily hydrolase (TIGR01509 family)